MENPLDEFLYADSIKTLISIIGHKAAAEALLKECRDRLDATEKQLLSMDGAFAQEVSEIIKDYPDWEFKFEKSGERGFRFDANTFERGKSAEQEERLKATAQEIKSRVQASCRKYNKVQLPDVDVTTAVTPTTRVIEDEA